MAFDFGATAAEWHVLIEVALDGGTVYYADEDLVMDDGTAYEGRILSIPVLQLSAGQVLDPRIVAPQFVIGLSDADSVVRDSTDSEQWGNRIVTLRIGQGTDLTVYEAPFTGVVRFPGGIEWDATITRVSVDDLRSRDAKSLPTATLDPDTYTNMETKSEYQPEPLLYGDWRTTAGGGERVPAYQIDSTAGSEGKFSIAGHALKEIEKVWQDENDGTALVDITAKCTMDAANGQFTIISALTTTYDPDLHTISANVQGATDDGLTSGTMLQTMPAIMNDILQTHLGVVSGDVDATAIAQWETELGATDYVRRWVGRATSSDDLLRDLLVDGFADLTIEGGAYKPVYRVFQAGAGLTTITTSDIRERNDGAADFRVKKDPERAFLNEVVGDYRHNPMTSAYLKSYTNTNSGSVASVGATKRRRLTYKWRYIQASAEIRSNRELYMFSSEPEMAQVRLDPIGLQYAPTEQFVLQHDKYVDVPWQVRTITLDLIGKTAFAQCLNIMLLTTGAWASSSAPVYTLSTSLQQAENGFWTNAIGEADTGDASSAGSIWF